MTYLVPARSRRFSILAGAVVALGALSLAGCGDDDSETSTDTTEAEATTTSEAEATTTTEGESTTTTADDTSTTATDSTDVTRPPKTEPTGDIDESATPSWQRTAVPYRGQVGDLIDIECDAGGEPYNVWGTNIYTDDSSVCTAAVHVGLITFDEGGTVTIEIVAGEETYVGSLANDVESIDYGSWGGSFSFPDAYEIEATADIGWEETAAGPGIVAGSEYTVVCEAGGVPGPVWGTDVYTSDSSICTAAVHAGLITVEAGGEVTYAVIDGQETYDGSTANGITTSDYGSWALSFEFVAEA